MTQDRENYRLTGADGFQFQRRAKRYRRWSRLEIAAAIGLPMTLLAAADARGAPYIDLTLGYNTGDYGTALTSTQYSVAAELGYVTPTYNVSAGIPFLVLDDAFAGTSTAETGLGDAHVQGGATVWEAESGGTSVNLGASVKFATGDETTGLGTGATNYAGYLSINQDINVYTVTFLTGYVFIGSPAGIHYDDVVPYGISIQRTFRRTNIYTALQGETSPVPGAPDPIEWGVGLFHILNPTTALKLNGFIGLSDSSPDYGLSTGFVRWF